MSNGMYAKAKEAFISTGLDLTSVTVKAALVSSAYTPNLTTHDFWDDVSANVLGTPQTLASKTVTNGVFDAADVTFTAVAGGSTASYVVLYVDTGTPSTSHLIICDDTITGFPLATNGGDITVQWDNGSNKIFAL